MCMIVRQNKHFDLERRKVVREIKLMKPFSIFRDGENFYFFFHVSTSLDLAKKQDFILRLSLSCLSLSPRLQWRRHLLRRPPSPGEDSAGAVELLDGEVRSRRRRIKNDPSYSPFFSSKTAKKSTPKAKV